MESKRTKIVMLPTEKANKGCIIKNDINKVMFVCYTYLTQGYLKSLYRTSNHLYFTTDEEIKAGDWWLRDKEVSNKTISHGICDCKKIVATTDELITGYIQQQDSEVDIERCLPKPSEAFLKKYCDLGGIDKVEIEYIEILEQDDVQMYEFRTGKYEIKVDSHNTITIHQIKNNWTKEEVESLLKRAFGYAISFGMSRDTEQTNKWIKNNIN